jgi:hypothetical protein
MGRLGEVGVAPQEDSLKAGLPAQFDHLIEGLCGLRSRQCVPQGCTEARAISRGAFSRALRRAAGVRPARGAAKGVVGAGASPWLLLANAEKNSWTHAMVEHRVLPTCT